MCINLLYISSVLGYQKLSCFHKSSSSVIIEPTESAGFTWTKCHCKPLFFTTFKNQLGSFSEYSLSGSVLLCAAERIHRGITLHCITLQEPWARGIAIDWQIPKDCHSERVQKSNEDDKMSVRSSAVLFRLVTCRSSYECNIYIYIYIYYMCVYVSSMAEPRPAELHQGPQR